MVQAEHIKCLKLENLSGSVFFFQAGNSRLIYKVNQGLHILYQPNGRLSIGTYPVHRISMCLGFAANAAKKKVIVSYMNIFYVYSRDQMFQQITEQIIKIIKCCITQIFGKVRRWGTVKIAFTVTRELKNLKGMGNLIATGQNNCNNKIQQVPLDSIKHDRQHHCQNCFDN